MTTITVVTWAWVVTALGIGLLGGWLARMAVERLTTVERPDQDLVAQTRVLIEETARARGRARGQVRINELLAAARTQALQQLTLNPTGNDSGFADPVPVDEPAVANSVDASYALVGDEGLACDAKCRNCGCTEDHPCVPTCAWVSDRDQLLSGLDPMLGDLCSRCLPAPPPAVEDTEHARPWASVPVLPTAREMREASYLGRVREFRRQVQRQALATWRTPGDAARREVGRHRARGGRWRISFVIGDHREPTRWGVA